MPVRGYRVERLIGTGGAAAVYEARRVGPRGPGERVACKVAHTERRGARGHRDLVRQEAVLGLRVTAGHRNLVEILDFFDDDQEQLCIVMELVDGASVSELRAPDRRLPCPVVQRIAVEVLEALVYLHGRGVLHRDLSPRNILVTAGGVVKLADLGSARVMEQGEVHTETIRATVMYAPREAIERLPLDVRSDLFSLGAVLYDLVAGLPPCGDQSWIAKMIARNAVGEFPPLPPDTPADLAQLITDLIRPERNARRPQTAAEALALLRGQSQPMASEEELAGMVAAARARGGEVPADERPANVLSPGHVLSPRDAEGPVAARPAAHRMINRAADAVPYHVSDPLPDGVAERMLDAVAEPVVEAAAERVAEAAAERAADHVADAAPRRVVDAAVPGRVTESLPGRSSGGVGGRGPGAASRFAARRGLLVAAIMVCVLAFLLDDAFRGEQTVVEPILPTEVPAPIVVPIPAPPVSPVVVTPVPTPESPRHDRELADDSGHERTAVQRHNRHAGARKRRRDYVPPVSELPPWSRQ